MFLIPLIAGGAIDTDNIVPTCGTCKNRYRPSKTPREDILDINTIADYIEHLVRAVKDGQDRERVLRIKRTINAKLEQLAINMRYKTFSGDTPEEMVGIVDEVNSIPDIIEEMVETEEAKPKLNEAVKQINHTGEYRIIRRKTWKK